MVYEIIPTYITETTRGPFSIAHLKMGAPLEKEIPRHQDFLGSSRYFARVYTCTSWLNHFHLKKDVPCGLTNT